MRSTTEGMKIEIGDNPMASGDADLTQGDFSSVSWTEIHGHTNIGSFGDSAQVVSSDEIGRGRTRKAKGTRNAGSQTITVNVDTTDPGQQKLFEAAQSNGSYPIRLTFDDAPLTGTSSEGSKRIYVAFVMGMPENPAGANNFVSADITLEIDSNVVRIAATGGSA